jgi:hypothetical protein
VAGLTSTVLAEALVYDKPVISFGLNVAMRSHIHGLAEGFGTLKDICKGVPYAPLHSRDQTLSWLLSKQWPSMNPPEWVYEYIEQKG